jgi:alpha-1,2-mannosyltransferase
MLAGLALVWLLAAVPTLSGTDSWSIDFIAYRESALRLAEEGTLYLSSSLEGPFVPMFESFYLYPPPFGLAVSPIATLPASDGAFAWYLIHVAVLVLACALMPVRPVFRLWSFAIAAICLPVLSDLIHGNVSSLLLLPLVIGWRWLDRPIGSIAIAVAASLRITLGAFLIWYLVRRAWRPMLWLLIGAGALVLVTVPFVGVEGYRDYLVMMSNLRVPTDLEQNRQVLASARALGAPEELAWAALVITWLVAIAAIVASRRRDAEVGFMVTVAASMLLAPTMWGHYLSLLVLPGAFLAQRGRPWALVLPLLAWLPENLTPLWAIMALLLPFVARDARPSAGPRAQAAAGWEAPGPGTATSSAGPA